jgi:mRNA interferase YafQ
MKFGLAGTKKFKRSFKKLRLKDSDEAIYIDVVSKILNEIPKCSRSHPSHLLIPFPVSSLSLRILRLFAAINP